MCLYKSVCALVCASAHVGWVSGMEFLPSMYKKLTLIPSTEQAVEGKGKAMQNWKNSSWNGQAERWESWRSGAFARVGPEKATQSVGREESLSQAGTCQTLAISLPNLWAWVYACVQCVCSCSWQPEENVRSSRTRVTACELPYCWELNPGHMQEQQGLFTSDPSLRAPLQIIKLDLTSHLTME